MAVNVNRIMDFCHNNNIVTKRNCDYKENLHSEKDKMCLYTPQAPF